MSQTIECPSACTVTVEHVITTPVLSLSTADGALIAAAVVMVWTVGWAVRTVVQALHIDSTTKSPSED